MEFVHSGIVHTLFKFMGVFVHVLFKPLGFFDHVYDYSLRFYILENISTGLVLFIVMAFHIVCVLVTHSEYVDFFYRSCI